jgi:hypothetical protein
MSPSKIVTFITTIRFKLLYEVKREIFCKDINYRGELEEEYAHYYV